NVEELLEYQQKVQESGTILMIVGGGPYLVDFTEKGSRAGCDGKRYFYRNGITR
ncbi:hypothetical protein LEA_15367, partial [human gut metagenome]